MKCTQEDENEELQTAKTALQRLKERKATLKTKLAEMKRQSFRGPNQKESVIVCNKVGDRVKDSYGRMTKETNI